MDIVINFAPIQNFFNLAPDMMLWRFLATFGWVILGIMFLAGVKVIWLKHIRAKWSKNIKFTFLA